MADKKLIEVTKVTDMAYVPVIMADGSIGQIAKADLASVVAELVGSLMYGRQSGVTSANNVTKSCYFFVGEDLNDTPSSYGLLITYVISVAIKYQMFITYSTTPTVSVRIQSNSSWSSWISLSFKP